MKFIYLKDNNFFYIFFSLIFFYIKIIINFIFLLCVNEFDLYIEFKYYKFKLL